MTENLITLEEVSKHNTQQSTWLVIDSKVCFRFIFKHFFFYYCFLITILIIIPVVKGRK